jgi:hypothetical protein
VDAMTKEVKVSDEVFEAVRNELKDERQVVELSMYLLWFCIPRRELAFTVIRGGCGCLVLPNTNKMTYSSDSLRLQRCFTLFDSSGCGRNEGHRSREGKVVICSW